VSVRITVPIFALRFTNDKLQGSIRAFADTFDEKVIDGKTGLDLGPVFLLPPGGGAILRVNKPVAEH
jgi:hypothetical protein